jgi:hypothetical protein
MPSLLKWLIAKHVYICHGFSECVALTADEESHVELYKRSISVICNLIDGCINMICRLLRIIVTCHSRLWIM